MKPIDFKYKAVDKDGNELGMFASRGELNETELILDKTVIPLAQVYRVVHRFDRLGIVYPVKSGLTTYTIAPRAGLDRKLKMTIDRLCSYRWAEERHAELERQGIAAAFRTAKCANCTAVVDLTGFEDTPQFWCNFCERLQPSDPKAEWSAPDFSLCDRCRYYSRPIRYKSMYAILNVYSWREHYSCAVCMRREVWKMLIFNLLPPFIGVAFGVAAALRAFPLSGSDPDLPHIVQANALARKGRVDKACALYEGMLEDEPVQAGLRYNMALAHEQVGDWDAALSAAHAALADCGNYQPAASLVHGVLTKKGYPEQADRYLKNWGVPSGQSSAPAAVPSKHVKASAPRTTEASNRSIKKRPPQ